LVPGLAEVKNKIKKRKRKEKKRKGLKEGRIGVIVTALV